MAPPLSAALLARGANVNAVTPEGITPLMLASANDLYHDIVKMLLDRGADIDAVSHSGLSASLLATDENNKTLNAKAEELAHAEGRINGLHLIEACLNKQKNAALDLIYHYTTDLTVKNVEGLTPLMAACIGDLPIVVNDLLGQANISINEQDNTGSTALLYASQEGSVLSVKFLLGKGADASIKNHEGKTALDVAKNAEIRELLSARGGRRKRSHKQGHANSSTHRRAHHVLQRDRQSRGSTGRHSTRRARRGSRTQSSSRLF
jgi:ankyrin repeat protein